MGYYAKERMKIDIKQCNCGGKGVLMIWSASPTLFIKCDKCGKTTGDFTRKEIDWAEKAAIRTWNRLINEEKERKNNENKL